MSDLTRRSRLLSCCGSAALLVLAVAASSCAGPQSARVTIDGREYFVPHGKRAREYGPSRRSRTPEGTEGEIVRTLRRISGGSLEHDSRLRRIAELYFDDLTKDGLPGEARSFSVRYHGLTDASVGAVRFEGPDRAALVKRIAAWGRQVLRGSVAPNRVGVVVQPVAGGSGDATASAQLILAWHYLEVDPIRQRVKRGGEARFRARLLTPLARPKVSVTTPGGAVVELAVGEGPSIDVALPTDQRGRIDVQVSAEHAGGTVTVAAFPIWVGRSPPSQLRLPRAESSETFAANTIRLSNEERTRLGLAPLEILPLLGRIALADAHDAANGASDSPDIGSRLAAARFCGRSVAVSASNWRTAEGLHAAGVQGGYLRALGDPDVTHLGVGAVAVRRGGDRIVHVTQILAHRGWTLGRASCQTGETANAAPETEQSAQTPPPPPGGPPPAASPSPALPGPQPQEPAPVVPNPPLPPIVPPGPAR